MGNVLCGGGLRETTAELKKKDEPLTTRFLGGEYKFPIEIVDFWGGEGRGICIL